jgi:pyruvate,water dikinase
MSDNKSKYIRWFEDTTVEDVPFVGEKNASLGEMYRELTSKGVKIPNGFSVTVEAYWHTLKAGGILEKLKIAMEGLDIANVADLSKRGKIARDLILGVGISDDLWEEIKIRYDSLCEQYGDDTDVAVRSSATAEDLPTASFSGQQGTLPKCKGLSRS